MWRKIERISKIEGIMAIFLGIFVTNGVIFGLTYYNIVDYKFIEGMSLITMCLSMIIFVLLMLREATQVERMK
ncbi:hypothetical protein ABD87_14710 [Lysinibacillus sphaericus]|nr:hypothetical protein [Lysinibacillus sphaericus]